MLILAESNPGPWMIAAFSVLLSALVSGLVAWRISYSDRRRQDRMELLSRCFSTGFSAYGQGRFEELRLVKLLFHEHVPTRHKLAQIWEKMENHEYDDHPVHFDDIQWSSDMFELLDSMAKAVGYKHRFTQQDFEMFVL